MYNIKMFFLAGVIIINLLVLSCQAQPNRISIVVDGETLSLTTTEAKTVRDILAEAGIVLAPLDRAKPDLYTQLKSGMLIEIIRVQEKLITEREVIPFEHQTIINEALPPGETRLTQLGTDGEYEITIRAVYENGEEVNRTEVSRLVFVEPVPEILVAGRVSQSQSIPIDGTIAYISNGNAWVMRNKSGSRRILSRANNLDGRVFSLSPDGSQLIYTRKLTDEIDMPLNELWLSSTTIVGERPITVGLRGLLQAEWSPAISTSVVAYSTAERTVSSPGWKANNDLWLLNLKRSNKRAKPVRVLPANTQGLYPWWGTTFTWSPDGQRLAYARAGQIGIINLRGGDKITPLLDFTPFETFGEWVWIPHLGWSPNNRFIAVVVHGQPLDFEPAEENQQFDLWLISIDGTIKVKVSEQVGMWANPVWGQDGIAFGEAENPLQSANSRYTIRIVDGDGSNKQRLFPFQNEAGVLFPELVWSPSEKSLLFVYNGNLYLVNKNGNPPRQLTTDSQASHLQWVK